MTRSKIQRMQTIVGGLRKDPSFHPFLQLLLAIIERAAKDAVSREHRDAIWWFADRAPRQPGGFTFVECCDYLGLNPDATRERLFENYSEPA